jgi:hypothetical protein
MLDRHPDRWVRTQYVALKEVGVSLLLRLLARRPLGLLRAGGLTIAATLVALAAFSACIVGDDDNLPDRRDGKPISTIPGGSSSSGGSPVVMAATFTPTTVGDISSGNKTATAAVFATQTATLQPTTDASPATFPAGSATPTQAPNEVRPPEGWLAAGKQRAIGAWGKWIWYEPRIFSAGGLELVPYVTLPPAALTLPAGASAHVEFTGAPAFPTTGGRVQVFNFDTNIAIPQDERGNIVGDTYAFVEQEPPVQEGQLGSDLRFTPNVPPGNYIVRVDTQWQAPPDVAAALPGPMHVEYIFLLQVP